jgi:SAM-dependent methyltransferase
MQLIEIGPSYSPIVPKADGWQTTVIDHATQAEILAKYQGMGVETVDRIEEVDYVWKGEPLTTLIPEARHGTFDGLVASHVGEHLPDLIAFLQSAATLIKPDGVMALALPDKRVCFDFFQPLTTTGDLVAAHAEGRTRHARRTFFNQAAYFATRDSEIGWAHAGPGEFRLPNPLSLAQLACDEADESPTSEYRDSHAWAFTPKSFELLILELNLLGHVKWAIREIQPALGVEFYIWLEQKKIELPDDEINPLRLSLLMGILQETKDAIAQTETVPEPPPAPPAEPEPVPVDLDAALRTYDTAIRSGDTASATAARDELLLLAQTNSDLVPRLYRHALFNYKAALLRGDDQEIAAALNEIAEVLARIPHRRRRMQATLALLRNPAISKMAFALRRVARPAMLWAFRA